MVWHNDPSKLDQTTDRVEGIVSSLAQIKYGEKWSAFEIKKRKNLLKVSKLITIKI